MFLDAFNNILMQLENPNLAEDFETKEDLVRMLQTEAKYLSEKRDKLIALINTFLSRVS
jgi:hypothetical protein